MEQEHFKVLCFLLRFVLLLQLTNCINHQFGADASQSDVYERLSKIEAHNRQQEKEVSVLKIKGVEDRSEITQLRNRVARLEASSTLTNLTNKEMAGRKKRPFRLIPTKQLSNGLNKNDMTKKGEFPINDGFYGHPTSCSDLGTIGYTLNGFYMVKGKDESNQTKIQTVYCQFSQPQRTKHASLLETQIGIVDVKSSLVQFSVGSENWNHLRDKIVFREKSLNVGNGFDWENQWFLAPYPGTYFFSISGTKNKHSNELRTCIVVNLNGINIGEAISSDNTVYGGYSYQFTRKLIAADKIEIFFKFGEAPYSIYFTGWMLNEDL